MKIKKCKRCKGTGFIETYEKDPYKYMGVFSCNIPRITCPKRYGKGVK